MMSPRQVNERLRDILESIREIKSFVSEMSFETFKDDLKTLRAVELNFIIIGEAASAIPDSFRDNHPGIPWHLMRGIRNRLVHMYFSLSPKIIWDTIQQDLPLIETLLNQIVNQE